MIDAGAPAADIDAYLGEEGFTADTFKAAATKSKEPKGDTYDEPGVGPVTITPQGQKDYRRVIDSALSGIAEFAGLPGGINQLTDLAVKSVLKPFGMGTKAPVMDFATPTQIRKGMRHIGALTSPEVEPGAPKGYLEAGVEGGAAGAPLGPVGALAGALGGLGGEYMRQTFPGNTLAEVGGTVLGGGVGASAPALKTVTQAGGRAVGALTAPFTEAGRQKIVGGALNREAADPARAIANLEGYTPLVPGSMATTSEAALDPALAILERGVRHGTPQGGSTFALREAERNTARRAALENVAPPGSPGAQAVEGAAMARREAIDIAERNASEPARRTLEQVEREMGAGVPPETAGPKVLKEYQDKLSKSKAAVSRAYESVDPEGSTAIPIFDVKVRASDAVDKIYGRPGAAGLQEGKRVGGDVPAELASLVEDVQNIGTTTGNRIAWADLQTLRSRAAALAGDGKLEPRVRSVAREIRASIDAAAETAATKKDGFTPEQAQKWAEATGMKKQQEKLFGEGAMGDIGATRAYGERVVPPSAVTSKVFHPGRSAFEDAAQFNAALGGSQEAVDAVKQAAIFDLRRYATGKDGVTLDPQKLRQWSARHREALDQFPDLRDQVSTLAGARAALAQAAEAGTTSLQELEKSSLGYFLRQDPDKAIGSLIGSKSAVKDVNKLVSDLTSLGDTHALNGLRKGVLDHIIGGAKTTGLDAAGNPTLGPAAMIKGIEANQGILKELFTRPQLDQLNAIAKDIKSAGYPARAGTIPGSPTVQNLTTANLIARTVGGYDTSNTALTTLLRPIAYLYRSPETAMQELLIKAMFDPKLGAALMRKATGQNITRVGELLQKDLSRGAGSAAVATPKPEGFAEGGAVRAEQVKPSKTLADINFIPHSPMEWIALASGLIPGRLGKAAMAGTTGALVMSPSEAHGLDLVRQISRARH